MSQLDSLTAYLKKALGDRIMKACEIESDELSVQLAVKEMGLDQRRIAVVTYTAVFWFFDFPWRQIAPALLPAVVAAWLIDEGGDMREDLNLSNATISRDNGENERSMTLTLEVDLYDVITVAPDDKGAVTMDGKNWRLVDPQIWIAQEIKTDVRADNKADNKDE